MNELMKDKVFHVISNTHWDREWRFSFQRNRQMLVDMIDSVLQILQEEPKYTAFHLDSQSIVLKDYLEIKPHKLGLIKKLIKEKRLLVGPWYILPEEFQVGGENLIRNLLLGHKTSKEFGGVSKIGYSPFSWGQISQLPQLYKEFGIDLIMFYRGINSIDSPKAEFLWEGADGTKAISSRFSTMPRYNFYFYIYRPVIHDEGFADVEYKWERGGTPFHFADKEQMEEDFFILSPIDSYYSENIEASVNAIVEKQVSDFTTPNIIWMEGHDSSGPNIKTVRIIEDIRAKFPGIDVRHSTLEDYAREVFSSVNIEKLNRVSGERRSSQFDLRSGNMYGYTTSARMYLKQMNFDAERFLQFYAEPFNIFSALLNRDINDKYIDYAWELIIQNSAHDSIGGCSLDAIHEDMVNRYKQSIEISKGVFERSVKHIVKQINTSSFSKKEKNENEIYLVAFNPNNSVRSELIEAFIDVPKTLDKGGIKIIDKNNKEVRYQLISKESAQPVLEQMIDRPMFFDMIRYNVQILPEKIPSFGYKTLKVIPVEENKSLLRTNGKNNFLENKYLKVNVNKNGTFNLLEKASGKIYKNLGWLYDEGEKGHAWVLSPKEPIISTLKGAPKIDLVSSGELQKSIKIRHKLLLPLNLKEREKKNCKKEYVNTDVYLTLSENSKHIAIKVDVDNKVESHRLRIMFPTNLEAKSSYGEGQFDVVKRTLDRPDTKNWVEQPMYDFPMHQFVDITDSKNGLAFFANGLKEYEVLNDKQKTLAVTLIRSFENIIAPSSKQDFSEQKGSQCLGRQSFKFALYPHRGDWLKGNVYNEAINFANPIRLAQIGCSKGSLPVELSLMKFSSAQLQFSALKKSENEDGSAVLRVYNPTTKTIQSNIEFLQQIKSIQKVTLEELFKNEIKKSTNNSFSISIPAKKINTYKIYFEEKELQ